MEISKTATGVLAAACIVAGAGGAYLAFKATASPSGTSDHPTVSSAVEESETVVNPTPTAKPARPSRETPAPKPAAPRQARVSNPVPAAPTPRRATQTAPVAAPVVAQDQNTPIAVEPPLISDNHASRSVDPPGPIYEELVVSADSVIGLQLESPVTSEQAQVEDRVVAHVTRDVRVGDRVAIPSGARAFGEVTLVERGGKLRDRARLGVRFTSITLADGSRLPIHTDTIYREGEPPGRASAAKIGGGAIGGAILGGILGGAKGAAIGSSIGAGAGTAAVVASDRSPATLSAGSPLTVRLQDPVVITVEK